MRSAWCLAWTCLLSSALPQLARAADLAWAVPADCPERESVEAQVARILGKPLSEVETIDFEARIRREQRRRYRLTLITHSRDHRHLPRERELVGQTCAEVSEAAAVAIAMAVSQAADAVESHPPVASEPEPEPEPEPESPSLSPPAPPPAAPPGDTEPPEIPEPPDPGIEVTASAAVLLDTAVLPSATPGATLELSARYRSVRLSLVGAIFAAQDARLEDGRGGEFGLSLVGVLLCLQPSAESLFVLGCAGFELGSVSAEGLGLGDPNVGDGAYRALRVDLGAGYRFHPRVAAIARLGGAAPLPTRTQFVVDRDDRVHEVPSLTVRALVGFELFL